MFNKLPYTLYFVVGGLAVAGWLALIIFPRQSWANFWFSGLIVPLLLCALYVYLFVTFWFIPPAGRFSEFLTLEGIHALFENRGLLLVAWINLITMDLVVGAWMTRKAAQIRMPYIYLVPCLVWTFLFAGFGFALFAMFVAIGRGWSEIARFDGMPPTNTAPVFARPDDT